MSHKKFNGLGVALITPFTTIGEVDYESLSKMVNHIIDGKCDYIVVLGTTAENPTLSPDEAVVIRNFVKEVVDGRVPLVLGIGSNNTKSIVEKLKDEDLSGYEAILSVVPFYNKPTQEGIYRHYMEIANSSPLPVILYNVPGRTGVNMEAETTLRLANDSANIIGVKEASGNLKQIDKIINERPEEFLVISGDDGLTFDMMSKGANGVISVLGNAYTKEFGEMVHLLLEGRMDEAELLNEKFHDLYKLLFAEGNPAGIKCLLAEMGFVKNQLRLPLTPVSSRLNKYIKEYIINI